MADGNDEVARCTKVVRARKEQLPRRMASTCHGGKVTIKKKERNKENINININKTKRIQ